MDTMQFEEMLARAQYRQAVGLEGEQVLAEVLARGRLPRWVEEFRAEQGRAILEVVEAFKDGNEVVILDAPTGSGKTLIAETVRQLLDTRMLFICHSKSLQQQFIKDFEYAALLQGRSNYPTERADLYETLGVSAADCTKEPGDESSCRWCSNVHTCPYELAKARALRAEVSVLNSRYFLTESNGPGRFSRRDFVVVDEADTAESELMGYVEFDLSPVRVRRWGLGEPKYITKEEAWLEWVKQARQVMGRSVIPLRLLTDSKQELEEIREAKAQAATKSALEDLEDGLSTGTWVYTGKSGRVSFKPVTVDSMASKMLWQHAKRWLLMSASIISPEQRMRDLGFNGRWKYISMTSPFRKEARRIIVKPVALMSRTGVANGETDNLFRGLAGVLDTHPYERVLLHTVSYELTQAVAGFVKKGRKHVFTYDNARGRELALQQFKATPESVLVAPSMDRGIDLPGDLCRVVGICKVPFGNLGDRQVNSRLHRPGGRAWYNVQTISTIVQMTGRGVRNEEDWCVSYILDRQFKRLFNQNRSLFPSWWKEALEWQG